MRVRTYFYLNTVQHRPKKKLFNIALDCLSDITSEKRPESIPLHNLMEIRYVKQTNIGTHLY